jgi:acetoin utilization protein AcuC
MLPTSINGINRLPAPEKRRIYSQIIPYTLIQRFCLTPDFHDRQGNDLLQITAPEGSPSAEMALYHQVGFRDPVFYGHVTDTVNCQIHVLLYILNDPDSPRFDVDCLPDGTSTEFGTSCRNLIAERAAMEAGLAPGQIRRGLRLLRTAVVDFDAFVTSLGHDIYFSEPLHYHNAILLERDGFAYEKGRHLMERIHKGFGPGGDLRRKLDGSTPFRRPEAANSIRLRSWAIHDGILGEPFTGVTMYKHIDQPARINLAPGVKW